MSDKAVPRPVLAWEWFKDWLSATVHLSHHQLHVALGLLLFVMFARLLRRPMRSFAPLLAVAGLEALNEASDFARYYFSGWPWTAHETLVDVALTLGPPLALLVVARAIGAARTRE
jgi:hypothetical protein